MYSTSKNGHFGAVLYSREEVIDHHNRGFIVYQPLFTDYGAMYLPRQSKIAEYVINGNLIPMEFRDGIPYWNNAILPVGNPYY
jgi:hypothetical protein